MDKDRWIEREEVIPYTVKNSIMQSIVSFLRSLNLRSDVNTVTSFRSVVEEVSGSGNGFPFTGDATIDGTLNIDFTETLDFISIGDADLLVMPVLGGRFIGDIIGSKYQSVGYNIYGGMADGVFDLVDAGFELPFIGLLSSIEDIVSGDTVVDYVGIIDQTPIEGNFVVLKATGLNVSDGLGGYNEYSIGVQKDGSEGRLTIDKINPDGDGVHLSLSDDTTGFVTQNELASDASVHRFQSNTSTSILDLLNDNLQSDVLLANNFADDAAAAMGGVPVGGLYHNAGALKIRIA